LIISFFSCAGLDPISNRQSPGIDDDVQSVSSDTGSGPLPALNGDPPEGGTAGDAKPKDRVKQLRKKRGGKPMPDEVPFLGQFFNSKATDNNVIIINSHLYNIFLVFGHISDFLFTL
jgi:hypothetical protein